MSEPTVLRIDIEDTRVRCPIRNEGHRCNQHVGHEGFHRAFGQRWGGVVIHEQLDGVHRRLAKE